MSTQNKVPNTDSGSPAQPALPDYTPPAPVHRDLYVRDMYSESSPERPLRRDPGHQSLVSTSVPGRFQRLR
jgi:hypothetical protein